eukprot:3729403-Lingulodinium_polyedra.AAC.1
MYNQSAEVAMPEVLKRRAAEMEGPRFPTSLQMASLEKMDIYLPGQTEGPCPAWLADACRYRDAFAGSALCFDGEDGQPQYLAFLYACQSPFYAMFMPLERQASVLPVPTCSDAEMAEWENSNWEFTFLKLNTYVSDRQLPQLQPENLKVLPDCIFEGTKVLSHGLPVPWAKWVEVVSQGKPLVAPRTEQGS